MSSPESTSDVLLLQMSGRTGNRIQDKVECSHALGALDGKHVALKKPKNSGAMYHNYKGFFSIVMLVLMDSTSSDGWMWI